MSKQRSNRSAPTKEVAVQKRTLGRGGWRNTDTKASPNSRDQYCDLVRAQVLVAWPKILEGLIEKAMSGGYQQAKLLLDLCDLAGEEPVQSSQSSKQQLCDALLDGLRLSSPERNIR